MTQRNRLDGGQIDRNKTLTFRFDGKTFSGNPGDTLASALLANGVRLMGRSFKYHRPRGVLTASSEELNAIAELRDGARKEPNTRAKIAELFEGLEARSQNRVGSRHFDLMVALIAGRAVVDVILADEDFRMGGRLNSETHGIGDQSGAEWASGAVAELAGLPNVRLMTRTTVIGAFTHNALFFAP